MSETFGPWNISTAESERMKCYQRLQDLLGKRAAEHDPIYKKALLELKDGCRPPHMWARIPSRVCRSAADLILPDAPRVTAANDEGGAIQARIDALLLRCGIYLLSWRALYWVCAQGTAFLTVSDVMQPNQKAAPVITLRRATGSVARNIRTEDAPASRAYLFRSCVGGVDLFLEHRAGAVKWHAYKDGQKTALPDGFNDVETQEKVPLVTHLTAPRGDDSDEGFGESDFDGAEDFCFEISNRLRQVASVLDKHADPSMNVPAGIIDENNQVDIRRKKLFEKGINGEGADYMVWQSQLIEAYTEIDRLTDLILLLTETPGALWGRDRDGQAESGRALKFKLLSGLGKARRTGGMFREGLSAAIRLALRREDILAGRQPSEYSIRVELSKSFIVDEMDLADYAAKLRAGNLLSVRRGVELTQELTGTELDDEVADIEAEVSAAQTPPIGAESSRFLA